MICCRSNRGLMLSELVIVIVIFGVLSAVAIPKYVDLKMEAREAFVKGSLGDIRSAVSIQYAKSALSGTAAFPMTLNGAIFTDRRVPEEPITHSSKIVTSFDGTGGWVYNSETGQVFCNLSGYSSY